MKWSDYGESSLTLLAVHCGIDKERPSIPRDPADFKRCVHLFDCLELHYVEIFELLHDTAETYSEWKIFADNWDYLMELYEEEKHQESAPKLYEAMRRLRESQEQ